MIKGINFDFGERKLVIPPLSLGALDSMRAELDALQAGDASMEHAATVINAAHAALRRNYPDITRDEVAELVDLGNMTEVMQAVMDTGGARRKELESGTKPDPSAATSTDE